MKAEEKSNLIKHRIIIGGTSIFQDVIQVVLQREKKGKVLHWGNKAQKIKRKKRER